jgi:hypothetical protein
MVVMAAAGATFAVATSNSANSVGAIAVAPPAVLTASCGVIGAGNVNVQLAWTASPTVGVTGYRVLYDGPSAGTNFTQVGSTGSATTVFTHQIPTALDSIGTHTYSIQSTHGVWSSGNSPTDAVSVTRVALVYVCAEL